MTNPGNTPEQADTFTAFSEHYEAYRKRQQEFGAVNRKALFDCLDAAGIETAVVTFDGCGDSGQIEDMAVTPETDNTVLENCMPYISVDWQCATSKTDDCSVKDVIENVCYDLLSEAHGGWENNDGAYGEFTFDVAGRSIALEYNERYTAVENYGHEWTEEGHHGA